MDSILLAVVRHCYLFYLTSLQIRLIFTCTWLCISYFSFFFFGLGPRSSYWTANSGLTHPLCKRGLVPSNLHDQSSIMTTWEPIVSNALGSAGAGILSRILTHPLDTVKARLQAEGHSYRGPFEALQKTYTLEGLGGLYRGFR
jgi:hypothetical protein